MFSLAKILFPVDYSEHSLGMARYAIPLAEHFRSEITLLHVLEPHYELERVTEDRRPLRELLADRREQAQQRVRAILSAELHGVPVKRTVLEGDAAQKIVEYAGSKKCSLILMSSKGRGFFRRLLLGSITAKVLHDAACPIWTGIHSIDVPPEETIRYRRVLCAIDLTLHSAKTLDWASQFAAEFKARLSVVHILPRLDVPGEEYFSRRWRRRVIDRAENEIEKLQRKVGSEGEVKLEAGDVSQGVCALAKRFRADLLVVGRGKGSGATGRFPATAYAIIRQASCPVVSV